MNKEPIYLSVVLSTYNDEKYIAESIQSILDQTYPYFEFIIVNDGSTDRTIDIIKSFKDSRIILIDKPNTGLIDSLNIGVRAAKYDWIARMDGDDIAKKNRFEEQIKLIKNDVVIISSQCSIIDGKGHYIRKTRFLTSKIGVGLSKILEFPLIVHPVAMYRKAVFEKVGGYDKNMYVAEDYDLWCKMQSYGKVIISSEYLLCLRKHGNNISTQKGNEQKINLLIGYIKYLYEINRPLSDYQYASLRKYIESSDFINRYKCGNGIIGFLKSRICRYIDVKQDVNIKELLLGE